MPFEEVDYWKELTQVIEWADTNVESNFYICWGAQAALYHRYGIPKYDLPRKMFGVFEHRILSRTEDLLRGFDDIFLAPHSRHTEIRSEDVARVNEIQLLAESDEAGVYIGSGIGGVETVTAQHKILLERGPGRLSPFMIPMLISNMASGLVSMYFNLRGPGDDGQ